MYVWVQVDGVALDEIVVGDGQHARKNNLPGQGALLKPIYVCMYVCYMYVCMCVYGIDKRFSCWSGSNGMFGRASDGSRVTRPEVVTSALKVSMRRSSE